MGIVKISSGNSKLGQIPSVSLPAIKTCRQCDCQKKCYARKLERMRPAVRNAYQHNLEILTNEPDTYWREVEASIMMSRFFRFHVSGDIPSKEYLEKMIDVARRNPHCEILCFTKKYEIVSDCINDAYMASIYNTSIHPQFFNLSAVASTVLPKNLHIILSGWVGLEMLNPYQLPEAHVRYRDGSTTAREDAIECGGNCTECAMTEGGCWNLQYGQQVIFNEH